MKFVVFVLHYGGGLNVLFLRKEMIFFLRSVSAIPALTPSVALIAATTSLESSAALRPTPRLHPPPRLW
jgi:hypothetical protein